MHTVPSTSHTLSADLISLGCTHTPHGKRTRTHKPPQAAIARAGGIEPLVALARDGTAMQKEKAASALWDLAYENGDNKVAMERLGWRL